MKNFELLIATILLLAMVPLVFAVTTINSPFTFSNHTGNVIVNATTDLADTTNVTCWQSSTGGASETLLIRMENTTASQLHWEETVSISALTDSASYNVTCEATIINGGSAENSTGLLDITFDSTNPRCTTNIDAKTIAYKGNQRIIWTSTDEVGLGPAAITIDRPGLGSDLTYTDVNRELTLTSQDTKYLGDWTFTLITSDRPGNTATCEESWKSYLPDGLVMDEPEPSKIPGWLIIAGIGVIIYFVVRKK